MRRFQQLAAPILRPTDAGAGGVETTPVDACPVRHCPDQDKQVLADGGRTWSPVNLRLQDAGFTDLAAATRAAGFPVLRTG